MKITMLAVCLALVTATTAAAELTLLGFREQRNRKPG
jgi:hypothetical protein